MNSKQRSFKSNKIRNMRLTSPADEEDLRTRWQEERLFYYSPNVCDEEIKQVIFDEFSHITD